MGSSHHGCFSGVRSRKDTLDSRCMKFITIVLITIFIIILSHGDLGVMDHFCWMC